MEPHLRGLAILYAATTAWAVLFAGWGILAALSLRVPRIVATVFTGPRLFGTSIGSVALVVRALPLPMSSIASLPPEPEVPWEDEDEGHWNEDGPLPEPVLGPPLPPVVVPPPFSTLPFGRRAVVLLGPFALLALLVTVLEGPSTIACLPHDAERLVRGALSPLAEGAGLARGFLRHLGKAPFPEALGMALRKQLAFLLLPFWGGVWSTLLFVARPDPARGPGMQRLATLGTLVQLGLIVLWLVAVVRVSVH